MKNLIFACLWTLIAGTSLPGFAQPTQATPFAVAASGNTAAASVGAQPGRSPYFLLFNGQGAFVAAVDNPFKDVGNAGIPAVDLLATKGVKVLVAGGFGPQIVSVMKSKGIRPVEFSGKASDAVKKAMEVK